MNSAIVVFLNDVAKVTKLTGQGIVINNELKLVSPLSSPAKKVILSNVPPFISDKAIANELSRYGRLVSPIKRIPLGCKSSLIKHLVSFRRMVYMVFKEGHLVRACPERQSDAGVSERPGQEAAEPAVVIPPAATVRPAVESPGVAAAPEQTESEPQAQPAAQKPTGATLTPEEPCVAEPVTVKSCSAELVSVRHGGTDRDQEKPCLTEPDRERPCSVDSGAVLELPALAEAGTEVQSCRLEAPVTTPVQEDGGDVEMEDGPTFKVPTKRKKKDADIKCFKCGRTGHLVRACRERQSDPGVSERPGQEAAEPAVVIPPAATVRPAVESPGVAAAPEQTASEPQAQPAAQKPTGATLTPEEPCMAEPVTVKSCSAELVSVRHGGTDWDQEQPCLTEPDLERPCSVDSGAVLELPALAEAGTEVQSCRLEAPVTTPVQEDGDIVRSLKALEIEIVELQCLDATGNQGHIEALKSKKAKMNDLLDVTAQGALVRSHFTSVTEMDNPSEFFFSLEQKNGQKRFIHAVRTESGDLLSEPTEIRKQTVSFYSKLYSSERSGAQIVEESFLKDLPKLSEQAARELHGELTLAELHKALQGMENGRAPGIDGLPVEFYKAFWAVIGQDVLEVLNDSVNVGQLPLSCRRAVLTLLPKKGDLTHLKNWRPVSLLCTDIKLLSKALASRLTKVMEPITHQDCVPDQEKGFDRSPAKKVMLCNVPPFISDEAIGKELSWYGRMVSPIKKIPLGCKCPLVRHLVSFRRMVFMVFKEGVGELNVVFKFTVDGFDYNIFVSSDTDIKCFKCGQTGHLAQACPGRQSDPGVSERPGQDVAEPAGVVPPASSPVLPLHQT
ncbi:hypothetical protein QTP86_005635 [Hemibagrus guttatus]|nr:hypothetical protein QTP86_005635 [Hemibagrus guttatus]